MNTEPQIASETTVAEVSRRNGNVAQLPKAVRDKINHMLLDGVIYADIIENLGEDGKHLQISNLSRWKDGGFQDWLKERQQVDTLRGFFELVMDMVANTEAEEIPDLTVKLLAARVCGVLTKLTPAELQNTISDDPKALSRLLSLVPKLSREALRTRKYHRSVKKEDATALKQRDPKKPFGDESDHRAVVKIVDQVLGLTGPLPEMSPSTTRSSRREEALTSLNPQPSTTD
ncbi:MAG: phage protein Gp27 family protein [Limisphaerales bacterium]